MSTIDSAIDEIKRVLIGNKDRATQEVYLNNAIRLLKEHESNKDGCKFCKCAEALIDKSNSDFTIKINQDDDGYYIEAEFDLEDFYENDWLYDRVYIKYCPMCGKDLQEVTFDE